MIPGPVLHSLSIENLPVVVPNAFLASFFKTTFSYLDGIHPVRIFFSAF